MVQGRASFLRDGREVVLGPGDEFFSGETLVALEPGTRLEGE